MIAIPAVDLREGACVQLVGGSYANEAVRLDNPVDVHDSAGAQERQVRRRILVEDPGEPPANQPTETPPRSGPASMRAGATSGTRR